MHRRKDLTGMKFNSLTAIEFRFVKKSNAYWLFKCDCGNEKVYDNSLVKRGHIKGCGCLRGERHGESYSIEYGIWHSMIMRCENPNTQNFKYYGERGIKVCRKWRESFTAFLNDMGRKPINKTLDRKNVNGNYCKSNCKWSSALEQRHNQRRVCKY